LQPFLVIIIIVIIVVIIIIVPRALAALNEAGAVFFSVRMLVCLS